LRAGSLEVVDFGEFLVEQLTLRLVHISPDCSFQAAVGKGRDDGLRHRRSRLLTLQDKEHLARSRFAGELGWTLTEANLKRVAVERVNALQGFALFGTVGIADIDGSRLGGGRIQPESSLDGLTRGRSRKSVAGKND